MRTCLMTNWIIDSGCLMMPLAKEKAKFLDIVRKAWENPLLDDRFAACLA